MLASSSLPLLPKDLASDCEVRWCPGCGDFSILAQMKKVLSVLGLPRERMVFVSGLGCAGRFPYYLNTYGFQTIHGRAVAVATGLKLARPELLVWVITGDGDGLSAGGNHLLHAMRRNVDIKVILINNEVLGRSKGQSSPTSRVGTRTKSNPLGTFDTPLRPLSVALAAEATFVARTVDVDIDHLGETLLRAARHRGAAFVEIYQNCNVFNPDVFAYASDKAVKFDNVVYVEHGKPMIFGKDRDRGVRLNGLTLEVVSRSQVASSELLLHDETLAEPILAHLLARMTYQPDDPTSMPEVMGVLRAVERPPHHDQVEAYQTGCDPSEVDLAAFYATGETWTYEENEPPGNQLP